MQRGSAQLFLVLLGLVLLSIGGYFYFNQSKTPILDSPIINNPISNIETYSNSQFSFEFKYSKDLKVKEDSEEEFNQRAAGSVSKSVGDFRKNFKGYVQYEPGKFLGGVAVLDKSGLYEQNPFTLWVFDNPEDLSIDAWYRNYWYYPFVWGDFTYKGKVELAPKDEATISGTLAKSGVIDYQPGKPKFVYLSKDKKMYLFRIIGEGDKILQSFKFTN